MNIVREIRRQSHGERIALAGEEGEVTFDSLFAAADEFRNQLEQLPCFRKSGIPRIGIIFPNGAAYIMVALAVLEAGACFVPVPDELTPIEREALISETALDAIIHEANAGIRLPLDLGFAEVRECVEPAPGFPVDAFEALNPAFIRFSSGTTGASKGVVLSHQSLLHRILAVNEALELKPGDRVLWTLPMAHHFAVTIILYLYHGVTTVLESSHRPERLFRMARQSRTNLLYGSPFHFAQLAQCQEAGPLPDLRLAISTASALSKEVAEAFLKRFQLPVTQALGIIEVGLPLLNTTHASHIPTALGQPLPRYLIKTSGEGELLIKGPGMFDAYLSPWQPRDTILQDGWFATGDLVEILADGTVIMHGRSKSVINVGGMKVFPEEIEAVLNDHPAIKQSRVFPEKHPTLGSFPCAQVILCDHHPLPTLRELRDHCRQRLAAFKIPMRLEAVSTIPLTASGKIKRH